MRSFPLSERVHDLNPIDFATFLKVFGKQNTATGLLGRAQNQSIPKGQPVQSVEIDGSEDIGDVWSGNVELGQHLHLAARDAGIDM